MNHKNIRNNRQLEFSRLYQISFLGRDSSPKIECLHLKTSLRTKAQDSNYLRDHLQRLAETSDLVTSSNLLSCEEYFTLVFTVDNRESVFRQLSSENCLSECCIYFPLSREKFIFSCVALCESLETLQGKEETEQFKQFMSVWENDIDKQEKNAFVKRDPNLMKSGSQNEYNV